MAVDRRGQLSGYVLQRSSYYVGLTNLLTIDPPDPATFVGRRIDKPHRRKLAQRFVTCV